KSKGIKYDAVMKLRGNKALYRKKKNVQIIDAQNVYDFCDVIYSSREVICFTSGTATLAAAIGKKATVYYGEGINRGFHHSKYHDYILVNPCPLSRFKNMIKKFLKKILGK
ncbi:MAG: hypothetical protein SNJ71_00590, partial [Bacteroidales bacterium]